MTQHSPISGNKVLDLIKQQSLPNLVQEEIERMIIAGEMDPGEPLREIALSERLGVSRGPIREAFRVLEERGLVTVIKNYGAFVRKLSLDEVKEIYEIRIEMESLIGRRLAKNLNTEGLNELETILRDMQLAVLESNSNLYSVLNLTFHDRLAVLSGNTKLWMMYSRMVSELSLYRRQTHMHRQSAMEASLREHIEILKALQSKDGDKAAVLLQRHAQDSLGRLLNTLKTSTDNPLA